MERVCHTTPFDIRMWKNYGVITLSMSVGLWEYCAILPLLQNLLYYFYKSVVLHCHCPCHIALGNIKKLLSFCCFQEKYKGIDLKWVTLNRFLFHLGYSIKPHPHKPNFFSISNEFSGQPINSFEKGIVIKFWF